jgi:hypothetical protein
MLADDNKVSFLPLFCIRAYLGPTSPAPVTSSPPTALRHGRPANRYVYAASNGANQPKVGWNGRHGTYKAENSGRLYGTSELVAAAFTTG